MNKPKVIQRYVVWGFIIWLVICPLAWFALQFTEFTGDLTRIGKWREKDFGWTIQQPTIADKDLISSPINEADVLVIGDSFSEPLVWQSVLLENGFKVTTLTWSQIGDLCADVGEKIKSSGFKGKHIFIQSAERLVNKQFARSASCEKTYQWPKDLISRQAKAPTQDVQMSEAIHLNGQLTVGIQTIYHSLALRLSNDYYRLYNWKSKGAVIQPLENGCQSFSHTKCEWGLFFSEDYKRPSLTIENIKQVKIIQESLRAYRVTWLIIPNKSSIYHRVVDSQFWSALSKEKLGPNLWTIFHEQKMIVRDLYAPNDTHLSTNGYRILGKLALESLTK